jgi:DNA modification methylase
MNAGVTKEIKEASRLTVDEWREYTKTVWHIANVVDTEHPAVFPVEIPKRLVKLFTFVGETVLDPFAGVGTTAEAALKLGRRAVCIEQNRDYVAVIRERLSALGNGSLSLHQKDSRRMEFIRNNSVSLVVTSPPYWNKADYGNNPENLGNSEGYREFFDAIRPVFEETFRVLQPGRKMCIVTANVNQYTNYGLLTFPLAADFIMVMRSIGYLLVGEIIWSKDGTGGRWGSSGAQRPIFGSYPFPPNFYFKNVHEHILVFAKPPTEEKTGAKAKNFAQLMALSDLAAIPLAVSLNCQSDPHMESRANSEDFRQDSLATAREADPASGSPLAGPSDDGEPGPGGRSTPGSPGCLGRVACSDTCAPPFVEQSR